MTIHTVRPGIITIEQHRRDTITTDHHHLTITTSIMAIAIRLTISIDPIAISSIDHRSLRVIMGHHLTSSIDHLLTEVVDKKSKK